ncbi:MAG: 30S ribosomal protein S6, partial [Fimbriimonadaceae bacterium]|nr:30S ribosomal protein S6 [Alphaproteobacteria bacterium]
FKGIIEAGGGSVGKTEYWGLKSLTYRIKKNRKAHFTLMNITSAPAAVAEMERQMRISDDVMRFFTLKVDELETEPSVMMQKRDDRRGGRGGDRGDFRGGDRDSRPRGPRPDSDNKRDAAPAEANGSAE